MEDGACLQMGIGALPDAVCTALRHHRNLGIHTEMMTNGLVRLIQSGVVDNSRKQIHTGRSIFTFAMGDAALYAFLNDNDQVEAYPVEYVNAPAVIAQNANVVSVNATLEVDLQGACNSEYRNGRQYSATGGQLDFVRGAYASPGGKSIIACHSTAAGGTVSRIVPKLSGPVTTPRTRHAHCRHRIWARGAEGKIYRGAGAGADRHRPSGLSRGVDPQRSCRGAASLSHGITQIDAGRSPPPERPIL